MCFLIISSMPVFFFINRSTTRLPPYLQMTSCFIRRECKSLEPTCYYTWYGVNIFMHSILQQTFVVLWVVVPHILLCCVFFQSHVAVDVFACAATVSSTRWTPLARCVRSRARARWPTWTKASSTPWRSTSSAPTSASVTPSVKCGWADHFDVISVPSYSLSKIATDK